MYISPIHYFTTTNIWLSLEDYYNAGLTPARAKELIESIKDPGGSGNLHCDHMGINGNWIVQTGLDNKDVYMVVSTIEDLLRVELKLMQPHCTDPKYCAERT